MGSWGKTLVLYDRYEKALADPNVDAVVLATPHARGQIRDAVRVRSATTGRIEPIT